MQHDHEYKPIERIGSKIKFKCDCGSVIFKPKDEKKITPDIDKTIFGRIKHFFKKS